MGGGCYSADSFSSYAKSVGAVMTNSVVDGVKTVRLNNMKYSQTSLHSELDPKSRVRECCNTEEHPNTVPVILALDVTGSMGSACDECAASIANLMKELYEQFKDVEVCVMGVGDLECDDAPLQVSQFESDVRVAKQMQEIYLEKGGGGNSYESYTAPWYFGLYHTRLDCYDKQGRKGIIITMGDEPLNPALNRRDVEHFLGVGLEEQTEVKTDKLYEAASKKFDIYHITVQDDRTNYNSDRGSYEESVDKSFKDVIGEDNYIVSSVNRLQRNIVKCIEKSYKKRERLAEDVAAPTEKKDNGEGLEW